MKRAWPGLWAGWQGPVQPVPTTGRPRCPACVCARLRVGSHHRPGVPGCLGEGGVPPSTLVPAGFPGIDIEAALLA